MKPTAVIFLTLALMSFSSTATAQEESRIWTSVSGAQIEAAFDSIQSDVVILNKTGGGQVRIRMNQLCGADQIYVRSRTSAALARKAGKETPASVPEAIEELFGDRLIDAKKRSISTAELSGKKIGIYFSAHWCPPCRAFTPKLVEFYNQLQADSKPFEIVFVSHDREEQAMMDYMKEMDMPWTALRFGDKQIDKLKKRFNIAGIPTLVIANDKGNTISANARGDVTSKGAAAFDAW